MVARERSGSDGAGAPNGSTPGRTTSRVGGATSGGVGAPPEGTDVDGPRQPTVATDNPTVVVATMAMVRNRPCPHDDVDVMPAL